MEDYNDFVLAKGDQLVKDRIRQLGVYQYYKLVENTYKFTQSQSGQTTTKNTDW